MSAILGVGEEGVGGVMVNGRFVRGEGGGERRG